MSFDHGRVICQKKHHPFRILYTLPHTHFSSHLVTLHTCAPQGLVPRVEDLETSGSVARAAALVAAAGQDGINSEVVTQTVDAPAPKTAPECPVVATGVSVTPSAASVNAAGVLADVHPRTLLLPLLVIVLLPTVRDLPI